MPDQTTNGYGLTDRDVDDEPSDMSPLTFTASLFGIIAAAYIIPAICINNGWYA